MPDETSTSVPAASDSSAASSEGTGAPASGSTSGGGWQQPAEPRSFADHEVWETGVPTFGQPGADEIMPDGSAPAPDVIPQDDSDLQGLNDPGVERIRQARQHARQLEADNRDLRTQQQQYEGFAQLVNGFGGLETVQTGMQLLGMAVQGNAQGYWSSLHQVSPQLAGQLLGTALDMWPSEIVQALHSRGYIADPSQAQSQPTQQIDPAELVDIGAQFHEMWARLPEDTRLDLLASTPATRQAFLERMKEADELRQMRQEVAQEREQERQQQIQQQVYQLGDQFERQCVGAVAQKLQNEIRLTGDQQTDGLIQSVLLGYIRDRVKNDPEMQGALAQVDAFANNLDRLRLGQMSAVFQARAGQILSQVLPVLSAPFAGLRQAQSVMAGQNQNRREPPVNGGAPMGGGSSLPRPDRRGEFDPENTLTYWDRR
jgi:hypothetical protein